MKIAQFRTKHNEWARKLATLERQRPKSPEIEIINNRVHYRIKYNLHSDTFTTFMKTRTPRRWSNVASYPVGYFLFLVQDRIDYKRGNNNNIIPVYEQLTPRSRNRLKQWCIELGLLNEHGEVAEEVYRREE